MYFVYILQSQKDFGYYVGCTSDLQKRIFVHNSGKTSSLKKRRPLKVIYYETFVDQYSAYMREKKIKSYKGGKAFKKLLLGGVA